MKRTANYTSRLKKKEKEKRKFVRSGIRTHAYRSRLRPERSALDHSAILTRTHPNTNEKLIGDQSMSVANMAELLLKSFLVYQSPKSEAWKVPRRLAEVLCDVTPNLAAYQTAIETRTHSSGNAYRTHRCLACIH